MIEFERTGRRAGPFFAKIAHLFPAPAIAAIVDVAGMVIYFSVARTILGL